MSSKSVSSKASKAKVGAASNGSHPKAPAKLEDIALEHGRLGHLGMLIFGAVAGSLLLWKFGSLGQWIGAAMLAMAVYQAVRAAQTFLHAPGTFRWTPDKISLPTGLCRGKDIEIRNEELEHAFFIRRAVPWTQAGPILIVEVHGKSYSYPRDWFASDSDQRRIARELNRRLDTAAAA